MACLLNKEDALNIYSDIYENILSAINDSSEVSFDPEQYIKELYADISDQNDSKFALEAAQAAPQIMLQVIATRKDVREYFRNNKISLDPINNLSLDFEKIEKVVEFISQSVPTLKGLKGSIINSNKSNKESKINNPTDETENVDKKISNTKVENVLTTTFQFKKAVNPDAATEEELEETDNEKTVTHNVIKEILVLDENRPANSDEIIYQGTSLALRPILLKNVDKEIWNES